MTVQIGSSTSKRDGYPFTFCSRRTQDGITLQGRGAPSLALHHVSQRRSFPRRPGSTHPADESLPSARNASQTHGFPKYSFSSFSLETSFSFIYCACKKKLESCVRTGTPKGRRSSCRLALRCLSTDDPGTVAFNSQGELREISLQLGFPVHGVDVISAVGNGPKHCQRRGECPIRP
jgi:hypothetical protein